MTDTSTGGKWLQLPEPNASLGHTGEGPACKELAAPGSKALPTHTSLSLAGSRVASNIVRMDLDVDFVINCWEATYRELLVPGGVAQRADEHKFKFAKRVLLLNNIINLDDARLRAGDAGVDQVVVVADRLDDALQKTGLQRAHLRRVGPFVDWALVAVTLPGSPYMLSWDAGVNLTEPTDWISPALELMRRRPSVLVANPAWRLPGKADTLPAEAIELDGDFAVGYGFSDQAWLVRRDALARPVYRYLCPASWRYPLASIDLTFEARVDAYMRRMGRHRATFTGASYIHASEGAFHPSRGLRSLCRLAVQRAVLRLSQRLDNPIFNPLPSRL